MNNFDKYFNSPEKLSSCVIEHDIEEELVTGIEECLRVSTTYGDECCDLGVFYGSWEFEEWLYSDLGYEAWRELHPIPKE